MARLSGCTKLAHELSSFFFSRSVFDLMDQFQQDGVQRAAAALEEAACFTFIYFLLFFSSSPSRHKRCLCVTKYRQFRRVCVCLLHLRVYLMCSMENKASALARRCGRCPVLLHNWAKALPYIQPLGSTTAQYTVCGANMKHDFRLFESAQYQIYILVSGFLWGSVVSLGF